MMKLMSFFSGFFVFLALGSAQILAGNHALLVGVQDYKGTRLRPLNYTENSVNEMAEILLSSGYKVILMTKTNANENRALDPTAKKIRAQLEHLVNTLTVNDTLLVAMTGHGVQFSGEDKHYFCPMEAKLNDAKTMISISDVFRDMEKCKASGKVLLVDACRDAPVQGGTFNAAGNRLGAVSNRVKPSSGGGTVAFFSCKEKQLSHEDDDLKKGVFFHHVNQALSGEANQEEDGGEVNFSDVVDYARGATSNFVFEKTGESQYPMIYSPNDLGEIILIRGTGPRKKIINKIGLKLQYIHPGKFIMGSNLNPSDLDGPHAVSITKGFYIGRTEVTQGQWFDVMQTKPWKERAWEEDLMYAPDPERPAVFVTWNEAVKFCKNLSELEGNSYRLPTEAEWEYSCRGKGIAEKFCFGDEESKLKEYGWFKGDGRAFEDQIPQPVAKLKKNDFDLFDMHGNVKEWCGDRYGAYPDAASFDPQGPSSGDKRVLRGGSCFTRPSACRSAARSFTFPDKSNAGYGFRVVRELKSGK